MSVRATRGVGHRERRPISLDNEYPAIRSEKEFQELVKMVQAQSNSERGFKVRGTLLVSGTSRHADYNWCESDMSIGVAVPGSVLSVRGTVLSPSGAKPGTTENNAQRLGGFQVWGSPNHPMSQPWDHWGIFFPVPGRFIPDVCTGWHYGAHGSTEEGAIGGGYGEEEPYSEQPANAPEGMEQEAYDLLTPAEKKLVWYAFATKTTGEFAVFLAQMADFRASAIQFAQNSNQGGFVDGAEDALRHAYWMCLMTKGFGSEFARSWGDAHEQNSTDAAASRMDLVNNAHGRKIASAFTDCGVGVMDAFDHGILQVEKYPSPAWTAPVTPQPPAPPMDQ